MLHRLVIVWWWCLSSYLVNNLIPFLQPQLGLFNSTLKKNKSVIDDVKYSMYNTGIINGERKMTSYLEGLKWDFELV